MNIPQIEKTIKYSFKNKSLCEKAFSHSSYAHELHVEDNERLEFFGDAILNFLVSEYLYENFGDKDEGQLSKIKAKSVSTETLSQVVENLGLVGQILLFNFEKALQYSKKTHADLFEAVLAAIYIDGGMQEAKNFVLRFLKQHIDQIVSSGSYEDYKTALQEYAQGKKINLKYEMISKSGPEHRPVYKFCVKLDEVLCGIGEGSSKAEAQINAAKAACEKIGTEKIGGTN